MEHKFDLSNKIKKIFDDCADKTDIWDNERYDKFRKMFLKEVKKLAGKSLTEGVEK